MKISDKHKEMLINEIEFGRNKMFEEQDLGKKLFYYSGIYSMISRIFSLNYNPHLQLMHFILSTTYAAINSRYTQVLTGKSRVTIPEDFFDNLILLLEKLADKIRNDEDTYDILEKIVNLTYLTTGNGYYLSQKGVPIFTK